MFGAEVKPHDCTHPAKEPLPARRRTRLSIEPLEARTLLAILGPVPPPPPVSYSPPNETLDQARNLGDLSAEGSGAVLGSIGPGPAGAADVDWSSFTLSQAASVTLATLDKQSGSSFDAVLSLYNNDPNDYGDLYDPLGHRLLAQDVAPQGGDASITHLLAPGVYYVAVSGAGNLYFNPLIAGSGYPGSTGDYSLLITATNLAPTEGPAVLVTDPAPGAVLTSSPLVIRVNLNTPLDPSTVVPGQTVHLLPYDPNAPFDPNATSGNPSDIPLAEVNLSTAGDELQLFPTAAVAPGDYEVFLAGDGSTGLPVLAALDGSPLGQDAAHPFGADFTFIFHIDGIEGGPATGPADDTPAGAHDLGDVTGKGLVQVTGAIGVDPAYNPANPNPLLDNPAAEVNLYHFEVNGSGNYQLSAEVFAGRIGSPLQAGLSLFRLDPATDLLEFVASNDGYLNAIQALSLDPVLFAGLTAGDYYLAVSESGNVPDPALGEPQGTNGIFDPNVSHSGMDGYTTGDYVLNLVVDADNTPPQVVSTSLTANAVLASPPTTLVVQFNKPVNLLELAEQAFQYNGESELPSVFISSFNPRTQQYTDFYPSLETPTPEDYAMNRYTFVLQDRLPNGPAELHLSGPLGLTDLAGNPLAGNEASGDYVVPFTVQGPVVGNPPQWTDVEPNDSLAQAQNLGPLFPSDLNAVVNGKPGVTITRNLASDASVVPSDQADYYQFELLQSGTYSFALSDEVGLGAGTTLPAPILTDGNGQPVFTRIKKEASSVFVSTNLLPGTYVVEISGWSPAQAAGLGYQLRIAASFTPENPTPLTVGPAPALSIVLASAAPSSPSVQSPTPPLSPSVPAVMLSASPPSSSRPPAGAVFVLFISTTAEAANGFSPSSGPSLSGASGSQSALLGLPSGTVLFLGAARSAASWA